MPQQQGPATGDLRRVRTDARLSATVGDLLRRHGYVGLTIERVAAESGVAKTTIYRRWATKAEMVFDLAIHRPGELPMIDTGSLAGDIQILAERAVRLVAGEPGRTVLPGLLADMTGNAGLTQRLRHALVAAAREDIVTILNRAGGRGELRTPVNVDEFHAALLGIPYAQVHLLAQESSAALIRSLSSQLLTLTGAPTGAH